MVGGRCPLPPFSMTLHIYIYIYRNTYTYTDINIYTYIYTHIPILTYIYTHTFNPLSVNPTKWSNTFKQFVGKLQMNSLSVFDHFLGLVLKVGLSPSKKICVICLIESPLKKYQKCFLFHLKSSFRAQVI